MDNVQKDYHFSANEVKQAKNYANQAVPTAVDLTFIVRTFKCP
jgi:hypothetical protein